MKFFIQRPLDFTFDDRFHGAEQQSQARVDVDLSVFNADLAVDARPAEMQDVVLPVDAGGVFLLHFTGHVVDDAAGALVAKIVAATDIDGRHAVFSAKVCIIAGRSQLNWAHCAVHGGPGAIRTSMSDLPNVEMESSQRGANPQPTLCVGFMDAARADVPLDGPSLRLGAGADCEVVLPLADAAAHHAVIHHDRRGLVLEVMPAAARIYVNARPVREAALLRVGDVLSIGGCKLVLKQTRAAAEMLPARGKAPALPASLVSLRIVAGPGTGKRLAVDDALVLDGSSLPGCVGSVHLQRQAGALTFVVHEAMDDQPPRFNGVVWQRGELHDGDQLAWRNYRFVVEAPGFALSEDHACCVPREAPLPEQVAGPSNEVWWLMVTASVLALGIALLLLLKP